MPFDSTPVCNTKPHWSSCRNGNLNQQSEPEFLDEIGSRKPDRSRILPKLKVLMLTSNLGYGGAEASFLRLANYLSRHVEVEVLIFSASYSSGGYHEIDARSICNLRELDKWFERKSWIKKFKLLKWLYYYIQLFRYKQKFDIVLSFLSGPNLLNAVVVGRAKVVSSIRGPRIADASLSRYTRFIWTYLCDALILLGSDRVVCASSGIACEYSARFPLFHRKVSAIEGTVDSKALLSLSSDSYGEAVQLKDFITICSWGRLHRSKGFDFLIEVFSNLRQKLISARLLIIGDGPEYTNLVDLCSKYNLTVGSAVNPLVYDVMLIGYRQNPNHFLPYCELFALTSRWEGLPNALIEALAMGTRVLATNCCTSISEAQSHVANCLVGSTFSISDYFRILPPPDDNDSMRAWEDILINVLSRSPPRLPFALREAIVEKYDMNTVGPHWLEVISSLGSPNGTVT